MDFEIEDDSNEFDFDTNYDEPVAFNPKKKSSSNFFGGTTGGGDDEDVYDYDYGANKQKALKLKNEPIAAFSPQPVKQKPVQQAESNISVNKSNESALERAQNMLSKYSNKSFGNPTHKNSGSTSGNNHFKNPRPMVFDEDDISIDDDDDEEGLPAKPRSKYSSAVDLEGSDSLEDFKHTTALAESSAAKKSIGKEGKKKSVNINALDAQKTVAISVDHADERSPVDDAYVALKNTNFVNNNSSNNYNNDADQGDDEYGSEYSEDIVEDEEVDEVEESYNESNSKRQQPVNPAAGKTNTKSTAPINNKNNTINNSASFSRYDYDEDDAYDSVDDDDDDASVMKRPTADSRDADHINRFESIEIEDADVEPEKPKIMRFDALQDIAGYNNIDAPDSLSAGHAAIEVHPRPAPDTTVRDNNSNNNNTTLRDSTQSHNSTLNSPSPPPYSKFMALVPSTNELPSNTADVQQSFVSSPASSLDYTRSMTAGVTAAAPAMSLPQSSNSEPQVAPTLHHDTQSTAPPPQQPPPAQPAYYPPTKSNQQPPAPLTAFPQGYYPQHQPYPPPMPAPESAGHTPFYGGNMQHMYNSQQHPMMQAPYPLYPPYQPPTMPFQYGYYPPPYYPPCFPQQQQQLQHQPYSLAPSITPAMSLSSLANPGDNPLLRSVMHQSMQQPLVLDLLQELQKSKEEAEWAKKALAEMLMRSRSEQARQSFSSANSQRNTAPAQKSGPILQAKSIVSPIKSSQHNVESKAPMQSNDRASDSAEACDECSQTHQEFDSRAHTRPATSIVVKQPTLQRVESTDDSNSYSDDFYDSFQQSMSLHYKPADNKVAPKSQQKSSQPRASQRYSKADVNLSQQSSASATRSADRSIVEEGDAGGADVNNMENVNTDDGQPTDNDGKSLLYPDVMDTFDQEYADRLMKPLKENLSKTLLSSQEIFRSQIESLRMRLSMTNNRNFETLWPNLTELAEEKNRTAASARNDESKYSSAYFSHIHQSAPTLVDIQQDFQRRRVSNAKKILGVIAEFYPEVSSLEAKQMARQFDS